MKKLKIIVLSGCLLFAAKPISVHAVTASAAPFPASHYTYEPLIMESAITSHTVQLQPFTANHTVSATKTYTFRTTGGTVVGTFSIHGTFDYDNTKAICTKAFYSSTISEDNWYFASRSAQKYNNKALGAFTIKNDSIGQTISKTVALSCSADGSIT